MNLKMFLGCGRMNLKMFLGCGRNSDFWGSKGEFGYKIIA